MSFLIIRASNTCVSQKDLNLRQRRWIEYMEDNDFELDYHPRKANIVADALSRKSMNTVASLAIKEWKMLGTEMSSRYNLVNHLVKPHCFQF